MKRKKIISKKKCLTYLKLKKSLKKIKSLKPFKITKGGGEESRRQPTQKGGGEESRRQPTQKGGGEESRRQPTQKGGGEESRQQPTQKGGGEESRRQPTHKGGGEESRQQPTHKGGGQPTPPISELYINANQMNIDFLKLKKILILSANIPLIKTKFNALFRFRELDPIDLEYAKEDILEYQKLGSLFNNNKTMSSIEKNILLKCPLIYKILNKIIRFILCICLSKNNWLIIYKFLLCDFNIFFEFIFNNIYEKKKINLKYVQLLEDIPVIKNILMFYINIVKTCNINRNFNVLFLKIVDIIHKFIIYLKNIKNTSLYIINTFFSLKKTQHSSFKKVGSILIIILLKQILNIDNKVIKHKPFILNILKDIELLFHKNLLDKLCSKCDLEEIEFSKTEEIMDDYETENKYKDEYKDKEEDEEGNENNTKQFETLSLLPSSQDLLRAASLQMPSFQMQPLEKQEELQYPVNIEQQTYTPSLNNDTISPYPSYENEIFLKNQGNEPLQNDENNMEALRKSLETTMQMPSTIPELPDIETLDNKFQYYNNSNFEEFKG